MAQLARRHDGRSITRLEELAQREAVSSNFLVQILNDLRRSGLIESKRGKAGGYMLAKDPESIALLDIVEAVEPSLLSSSTVGEGECGERVRQAWGRISSVIREEMARVPLRRLAQGQDEPMYYI